MHFIKKRKAPLIKYTGNIHKRLQLSKKPKPSDPNPDKPSSPKPTIQPSLKPPEAPNARKHEPCNTIYFFS